MVDNSSSDHLHRRRFIYQIITGGFMKSEVNIDELKKLIPSTRSMLYLQIIGLQIFMVAFLFSSENILYTILLLLGAVALTEGFEKTRLQNRLKQMMK
jgi:hypothetical protein